MKKKTYKLSNGKTIEQPRSWTSLIFILIIVFTYISVQVTGFNFQTLLRNGRQFFVILGEMFRVNWSYIPAVIPSLLETIQMSLLGSFLGAVVSLPFAYFASKNITQNEVISGIMKFIFSLMRTVPTLIIALIATFFFGLGSVSGTIAIFIFSFSYIGKLTYEAIETVDMGAYEALISMGQTKFQAFRYAIIPHIMPNFISSSLYNFEGNVRYAAILGYVGAGGIGLLINQNIGWRDYDNVGAILILLLLTVFIIEQVSEQIRKRLQ